MSDLGETGRANESKKKGAGWRGEARPQESRDWEWKHEETRGGKFLSRIWCGPGFEAMDVLDSLCFVSSKPLNGQIKCLNMLLRQL